MFDLKRILEGTYKFTIDHTRKHPKIAVEDVQIKAVGADIYRIRLRIRGEFPTNISNKGKNLRRLKPIRVEFCPSENVKLLSNQGHYNLGHLSGIRDSRLFEWFISVPDDCKIPCEIRIYGGTGGNIVYKVKL
ncbi:MAG: hypothetical protein ACPL7B_04370 [Candidatus Poribacteria bacterium]